MKELFMTYGKYKAEESGQRWGWRGKRKSGVTQTSKRFRGAAEGMNWARLHPEKWECKRRKFE